ncbi:hypothetical protein D9758_008021 [Tetrapyrgos nigripes]|uniref:Uncharacterized protein n=1 Tax=Tetrapyrgos nigripes TaxID=182062 RepID=A0A8H5FWK8_9AGAR|nr:hypothetical protein D9758_008021 [Tetrapyrgos nigripes]
MRKIQTIHKMTPLTREALQQLDSSTTTHPYVPTEIVDDPDHAYADSSSASLVPTEIVQDNPCCSAPTHLFGYTVQVYGRSRSNSLVPTEPDNNDNDNASLCATFGNDSSFSISSTPPTGLVCTNITDSSSYDAMGIDLDMDENPLAGLPGYPTKVYLHNCAFPEFTGFPVPVPSSLSGPGGKALSLLRFPLHLEPFANRAPWPRFLSPNDTLKQVHVCNRLDFAKMVLEYLSSLPTTFITTSTPGRDSLFLPCAGFLSYGTEEKEFLSRITDVPSSSDTSNTNINTNTPSSSSATNVNSVTDETPCSYDTLIQTHILGTISQIVKIIDSIGEGAPAGRGLVFQRFTRTLPNAETKCGVFVLPPTLYDQIPLAVIYTTPWNLNNGDFERVVYYDLNPNPIMKPETRSRENEKEKKDNERDNIARAIWAIAHDTCYNQGHFFILTNYTRWAFGRFSEDWTSATISQSLEPKLFHLSQPSSSVDSGELPGFDTVSSGVSIPEALVFWVQLARGIVANTTST